MQIPTLDIRLQHAKLSIDADPGIQDLQQPRASVNMRQVRPEQHFSTTRGTLEIDQEKAWDALALGNNLETMSKIYSQASNIALQGLGRIVEKGNQMAAIHTGGKPIASMAKEWKRTFPEMDFRGPASIDNVDVYYTPGNLNIETTPGRVELDVRVNAPIHHYERGKLDIYMSQPPSVIITPPQIDSRI
ncbi:DUF6470 family protein [Paenibacillus soyae]|uniref:DUF6470 family protein n=1 Tax=Paenibacillus soyae TaxID=2969249 RepID=A0A9X2SB73_9BACL|nr:DUF6470 family protein [Paenibacillus soyae]MCR2806735.1 DUF6470 family protein [Paenibacillus soyae]